MSHSYEPRGGAFLRGGGLSSAVRLLLAWNVILFLVQMVVRLPIEQYLGLIPSRVLHGWVWQLFTYMFLHANFVHILFNMLALWMFGSDLEYLWGTRRFVRYYFFTGVGAGITVVIVNAFILRTGLDQVTIGASGAIYGLLLAFGVTFPDRPVFLYFLFPMRAKYLVVLFGLLELVYGVTGTGAGISHFAHLGGILFGLIYLKGLPGQRALRRWRRERQRGKFTVLDFRDQDEWKRR
jgi:membrane associated rhomboid family serine protease